MSVTWLQPLAWWGLLLLAVPIAIHLWAQHQRRTVSFPSLRFLPTTQLVALRRRALSDTMLLVVRLLVLATAVAAVAAPLFVTSARARAWQSRTARAIVEVRPFGASDAPDRPAVALIDEAREAAFLSWTRASTGRAAEALASAVDWLNQQRPAARELVIVGDLRAGIVTAADIAAVPSAVGIRFLSVAGGATPRSFELAVTAESEAGTPEVISQRVTLEDLSTRVVRVNSMPLAADVLSFVTTPEEQAIADALRDAVLAEGLTLPQQANRRVVIELRTTPTQSAASSPASASWMRRVLEMLPGVSGGERDGALVVRVNVGASDPRAVHEVARIARAAFAEPLDDREPRPIDADTLTDWSRPPGPVPDGTPLADEGDRRWLWLVVLVWLALEHVVRRRMHSQRDKAAPAEEARVA